MQPACRFCLSSMHPMKQAGCGGAIPYCPGAARIEAGGDCPVKVETSSHRREQPLAPSSTPIELGLITGNCCSPCSAYACAAKMEYLSMHAWAVDMEILECPVARIPLSALLAGSNGSASQYSWCQRGCRSCRMMPHFSIIRLRGSTPDFCQVYSLAFPPPGGARKAAGPSPWPGLESSSAISVVGCSA